MASFNGSTVSTSTTTGALTVAGGVGISGNIYVGETLQLQTSSDYAINMVNTLDASFVRPIECLFPNLSTGHESIIITGVSNSTNNCGYIGFNYAGGTGSTNNYMGIGFYSNDNLLKVLGTGQVSIPTNITSTSTTTGSLIVNGGVGIGGMLYVGGGIASSNSSGLYMTLCGDQYGNFYFSPNSATSGVWYIISNANAGSHQLFSIVNNISASPMCEILGTANSTSTTTGALLLLEVLEFLETNILVGHYIYQQVVEQRPL